MKYRNILRHAFLIVITMTAVHVHAATSDYTLKYNTWELIAVPNPIPSAVSTPMKMFGERIVEDFPLAEYGINGDWVMFSYSSGIRDYEVVDKDAVFDPGRGYWVIQAASIDDMFMQVDLMDAQLPTYSIGDTGPAGGFVFYVTNDGLHGYEAAPEDQGSFAWGCRGTEVKGAQRLHRGSGRRNTDFIVAECGYGTAASSADFYSHNGYNDWYLPSLYELDAMYSQLHRLGQGGFVSEPYWSSSEVDVTMNQSFTFAWHVYFGDGASVDLSKDNIYRVRAIRAF